ncbi:MAG: hypothetical protein AAF533_12115 [Acidobacteriota bacterium]
MKLSIGALSLALFVAGPSVRAGVVTIDFDDRAAPSCVIGTAERIGNQWEAEGVVFVSPPSLPGAIVEQPCFGIVSGHSAPNIVAFLPGPAELPVEINFDPLVTMVSLKATNWNRVDDITLTAYDSMGVELDSDTVSTFGMVGPLQQLTVTGPAIASAFLTNTSSDEIAIDDLTFVQVEPTQACCFADESCLDLPYVDCRMMDGFGAGDGTECATTTCEVPEACCFDDLSCLDLVPSDCTAMGGRMEGVANCTLTDCQVPEACCFDDGTCQDLLVDDCTLMDGSMQGPGLECATVSCPQPQACCLEDGTCVEALTDVCTFVLGGTAQGEGVECAMVGCPAPEACCFPDGSCLDLTPPTCSAMGGVSQGAGTDCMTTACPPTQACCLSDGSCVDLLPLACDGMGGTLQGAGTECATTTCPLPEACCLAGGGCTDEVLPSACAMLGGVAQGEGTDCMTATCPEIEACCRPDGTCFDITPEACATAMGTSLGPGTDCTMACDVMPPLPGWTPDGAARPGEEPLRVTKSTVPGDLLLSWSLGCSPEATDHVVHAGWVGDWYSHEAIACDTAGAVTSVTFMPVVGARYYLVVPVTMDDEGSHGLDSSGAERPPSATMACRPTQVLGCP